MNIILFGAGKIFRQVYKYMLCEYMPVVNIWDNDSSKWGKEILGIKITKPTQIYKGNQVEFVITAGCYEEISKQLNELGYASENIHNIKWFYEMRLRHFYALHTSQITDEEMEALSIIDTQGLNTYNVIINQKTSDKVRIIYDINLELYYAEYLNQRMYFTKKFDHESSVWYYKKLLIEQSESSPHCYTKYLRHSQYDYVIDAGSCEGIFALNMVDKCEKLFLVENNKEWTDLYPITFGNSKCQVEWSEKMLGNVDSESSITIDTLLSECLQYDNKRILIKMDIEGAEEWAIKGGERVLKSKNDVTVIACAYHHIGASENIGNMLSNAGFTVIKSARCMFFSPENEENTVNRSVHWMDNDDENYRLRNGLVIGYK